MVISFPLVKWMCFCAFVSLFKYIIYSSSIVSGCIYSSSSELSDILNTSEVSSINSLKDIVGFADLPLILALSRKYSALNIADISLDIVV